jgi:UDP-N-acetylenolpyruvoylglucosamine reductase
MDMGSNGREWTASEPLLWLGLGSNLLVDDAGFPGTVIRTQACMTRLERRGAHGIHAESGVSCAKVARFTARLIEAEGLKGHRIGGAQVSEKHANFIINAGEATAADIRALIDPVQRRVEAATGVRLAPEIKRVAGDHS